MKSKIFNAIEESEEIKLEDCEIIYVESKLFDIIEEEIKLVIEPREFDIKE